MSRIIVVGLFIILGTGCQSPEFETVKDVMPNVTEANGLVHCNEGACLNIVTFARKRMWMERGTIETEKFEKRIVKNHERWDETAALHVYFANEDEEFRSAFSGLSLEEALDLIRDTDVMPAQIGITIRGEDGIKAQSFTDPDWISFILGAKKPFDSLVVGH